MAEQQQAEGENIFVYLGGEQVVPFGVTHARIDRSVKIIPLGAFVGRRYLVSVETHGGIEKIEGDAFCGCDSLRGIKLPGVREIGNSAFSYCTSLTDVELPAVETIGSGAFSGCSLRNITMPTVRTIERAAFIGCEQLTVAEFGKNLERIGEFAFMGCVNFQRIAIPLKDNIFPLDAHYQRGCTQFNECKNLTTVDIVGVEKIRKTISSLLLESWRNEMNREIDLINLVLPTAHADEKTDVMQDWIRVVINRMEHYKAEHYALLKEDMTQLELAVWKAKLEEDEEDDSNLKVQAKKAMIDMENARKERRITSGADINIIISNVLPFLQLLE